MGIRVYRVARSSSGYYLQCNSSSEEEVGKTTDIGVGPMWFVRPVRVVTDAGGRPLIDFEIDSAGGGETSLRVAIDADDLGTLLSKAFMAARER